MQAVRGGGLVEAVLLGFGGELLCEVCCGGAGLLLLENGTIEAFTSASGLVLRGLLLFGLDDVVAELRA